MKYWKVCQGLEDTKKIVLFRTVLPCVKYIRRDSMLPVQQVNYCIILRKIECGQKRQTIPYCSWWHEDTWCTHECHLWNHPYWVSGHVVRPSSSWVSLVPLQWPLADHSFAGCFPPHLQDCLLCVAHVCQREREDERLWMRMSDRDS